MWIPKPTNKRILSNMRQSNQLIYTKKCAQDSPEKAQQKLYVNVYLTIFKTYPSRWSDTQLKTIPLSQVAILNDFLVMTLSLVFCESLQTKIFKI